MLSKLKNINLTWWQAGIYEIALLCLGIILGSTWSELFLPWRIILGIIFILGTGYIIAHWLDSNKN